MEGLNVVLDSAPLIAGVLAGEPHHELMAALLRDLATDAVVPDPVVVEVDQVLRSRASHSVARTFLQDVVSGAFRRVVLEDRLFARAIRYDSRYGDLGLGLADASVMALAEKERAKILTFDFKHFRAAPPLAGGWWRLVIDEDQFRRLL